MEYSRFVKVILNRIGNLRIYYRDKNSGRQNTAISLKDYPDFYTYSNIINRSKEIEHIILDECFPQPAIDLTSIQLTGKKNNEDGLPKMDKLIEFGIITPGDNLYITTDPDNSTASLIDAKYVLYKNEKMTLNEWGCKVTGWQSMIVYNKVRNLG